MANSKKVIDFEDYDEENTKTKLEKALACNRQMQLQLIVARNKLETLLNNVKDNYKANDELLKDGLVRQRKKGVGIKGAYLKGGTFYLMGNMFFKDIKCRNCPNNPDYARRKHLENEMFPMDLELKGRHVWSTKDKQGVVLGIKEQIIDHLKRSLNKPIMERNKLDSEKLVKLLNMVPKDFQIDWDQISSTNVSHRHTAHSCEAIWNVFLNPTLKRSAWTDSENKKLLEASQKYKFQNWEAVAKEVGQRSDFQCLVQYQNYVIYMLPEYRSSKWTKEEDQRLVEVVGKNTTHGVINWGSVMAHFPKKPKTTLQSRYTYSLNPDMSHAPFSPEEDLLLLATVKEYGTKFSCFPRNLFPNRTVVQLRSRYKNTLLNRHNRTPWTLEDDMKLMEFVTKNGAKSWLDCATYLKDKHSRISCRTRFFTIKKYLQKNPDASIDSLPRKVFQPGTITTLNWKEKLQQLTDDPKVDLGRQRKRKKAQPKKEKPPKPPKTPKPVKPRKSERSIIQSTDYLRTLKSNELSYYNYFKYSYNFELDQDPCNRIVPNNEILTIVRSALNPQINEPVENYEFDATIPEHVRPNIKNALKETHNYRTPQLLPPNWSSAMGFRALCIHAASNDLEQQDLQVQDDNNDHIALFRQRLRTLFYSTALLSRLHPSMVGLTTTLPIEDNSANSTTARVEVPRIIEEISVNRSIQETLEPSAEEVPVIIKPEKDEHVKSKPVKAKPTKPPKPTKAAKTTPTKPTQPPKETPTIGPLKVSTKEKIQQFIKEKATRCMQEKLKQSPQENATHTVEDAPKHVKIEKIETLKRCRENENDKKIIPNKKICIESITIIKTEIEP